MTRSTTFHALALPCLLVAVGATTGCEETGLRPLNTAALNELSYTPDGCGYEVTTPNVQRAGPGDDKVGDGEGEDAPFIDHVHVGFAGPSDTTLAVNWRSDPGTTASRVLIGTDKAKVEAASFDGEDVSDADVRTVNGHFMLYTDLIKAETQIHEVHVCGLTPDTTYYYKVGGGSGESAQWSDVFETSTGPAIGSKEPVSIAVFGDARNPKGTVWPDTVKASVDSGADLMIFSGDAVFLGTQQEMWNIFFESKSGDFSVEKALATTPMMVSNGNHDALSVNYVAQFTLPQDPTEDESAQGEEWYSYDYANVHVAVLNDTVTDNSVLAGAQATWLRQDLAAVDRNKTPWVFVVHHRPFHTCLSTHSPDTTLRSAWQPIFDEYKVDMVINGHNHVYERTVPIRGLKDEDGQAAPAGPDATPTIDADGFPTGTIYVVSAGAGAELYGVSDECPLTHTATSAHNYVMLEIEDLKLTYTAYNLDTGGVIDSFSYSKE